MTTEYFSAAIGTSSYSRTAAEHGICTCTLKHDCKNTTTTGKCSGNGYGTSSTGHLLVVMSMDMSKCWAKGAESTKFSLCTGTL